MGALRHPAVKFRGKIYVGRPYHQDAINEAFKGMSRLSIRRCYQRVVDGKESIVFGFACEDGTDWYEQDVNQSARLRMYGFDE